MVGGTRARLLHPPPRDAKAMDPPRRSLLGRNDELGEELADDQVNEEDEEMYVGDVGGERSEKMACES